MNQRQPAVPYASCLAIEVQLPIYMHVARKGVAGVTSPLDLLNDITDEDVRAAVVATSAQATANRQLIVHILPTADRSYFTDS
jgi:hypothetical protein